MRTYISPIGYDTRRVTRPVINRGLDSEDELVLLRPGGETDTERATQTIADVEQFLQEIEPNYRQRVEHVVTDSFEETVRDCCQIVSDVGDDREIVVSLGGGARDILLPLTVAALVYARRIDAALFFSDLDNSVQEWTLPDLTARISDRAFRTFEVIVEADGWLSLSTITEETEQSKSTVIRHVNDLESSNVVVADTSEKAKRVRATFSGELLSLASQATV
jgi:CRISPR-associated protein Csa3